MKLNKLGLLGVISLLSYSLAVFISPINYPGYNPMTMAVSDLSAVGAPSLDLYTRLGSLFGPCAIVSIMAVFVYSKNFKSKLLKVGILLFTIMQWVCNVGYNMFPLVNGAGNSFQNIMHIVVTALVVILSISSLIIIIVGSFKEKSNLLGILSSICLGMMFIGAIGTGCLPKAVFGLFERFSTFSAVIFNAILGMFLYFNKFKLIDESIIN